jgi:predicted small metal-binding protein
MAMGHEIHERQAALPAVEVALVEAQPAVLFGGDSAREIDARHGSKLLANSRQSPVSILPTNKPGGPMETDKIINCPCGFVVRGKGDEDVVRKAQDHAKAVHGMELTREQALEMARPA